MSDVLLTPGDVAEMLDVSPQTLASWRTTGRYDLPFLRIGRLVRYRQSDIEEFLEGFEASGAEDLGAEDFDADEPESDDDSEEEG